MNVNLRSLCYEDYKASILAVRPIQFYIQSITGVNSLEVKWLRHEAAH